MKFSVIIPTYKRVDYLEEALKSIEGQTYRNYEVVVVNDFPDDKAAVDAVCARFENVRAIHHETSKGGNAARNNGISNSDGDLIAFLDDDDLWLPNKLEEHFKAHVRATSIGLVYSNCTLFWEGGAFKDQDTNIVMPADVKAGLQTGDFCPITSSSVTVTREAIKQSGLFDESLVSFQDWDMWFRIAHQFEFAYIPGSLVRFRQHYGLRTSKAINKRFAGLEQILKKWGNTLPVKAFRKKFTRRTNYFYADDLIVTNKKMQAIPYIFNLLKPEVISTASIKNFVKLVGKLILGAKVKLDDSKA